MAIGGEFRTSNYTYLSFRAHSILMFYNEGAEILRAISHSFIKPTCLLGLFFLALHLTACAEKEKKDRSHPAAFVTEIFGIDNGMPMREVQKQEFYFKKCELESRRPFQSRIEFSCNEN